jgi:hypothetical protein
LLGTIGITRRSAYHKRSFLVHILSIETAGIGFFYLVGRLLLHTEQNCEPQNYLPGRLQTDGGQDPLWPNRPLSFYPPPKGGQCGLPPDDWHG